MQHEKLNSLAIYYYVDQSNLRMARADLTRASEHDFLGKDQSADIQQERY